MREKVEGTDVGLDVLDGWWWWLFLLQRIDGWWLGSDRGAGKEALG